MLNGEDLPLRDKLRDGMMLFRPFQTLCVDKLRSLLTDRSIVFNHFFAMEICVGRALSPSCGLNFVFLICS